MKNSSYIVIVLLMLGFVAVAWVGQDLYTAYTVVEINPNAENFSKPIKGTFDIDILDEVESRIEGLPISPDVFLEIENKESK